MAYLAVLNATAGRRAGLAATLGVALGLLIVGLAASLGLTALVANSRVLYEGLRWGGVLYLLWLAYEGWRGEEETSPGKATVAAPGSKYFVRGLSPIFLIRRLQSSTLRFCRHSSTKRVLS